VDSVLEAQAGVISVAQARQHLSPKAIRHLLASGRWQRVHRSVLAAYSGPVGHSQQRWAAILAAGSDAVLAGLTALSLRGFATEAVHILLPSDRRARSVPNGVVVHRSAVLDHRDVLAASRPPRTRPARSLVDGAQWARTEGEARAIIAAGFQQRLVREDQIRAVLDRLTRARRHRLITQTVDDAVGGAHSLAEIDFVDLCHRHRLPEPTRQVVRHDSAGRRRYLDVLFEEWQVQVEIDGGQHMEVRQAWADMRRQNDLWIAGERVLRFPAWAIRSDPEAVATQVRAALKAAGLPTPTPSSQLPAPSDLGQFMPSGGANFDQDCWGAGAESAAGRRAGARRSIGRRH
jgi:very-short-patch-repair endonuclease